MSALAERMLALSRQKIAAGQRPVLGLNGPVGAGKTTLAQQLRQAFAAAGLQLAVASIDDAYLPWPERCQRMAGNPFGVSRVPPGSHDPSALLEPIRAWRQAPWTPTLVLPRFDKRLRSGEGDRIADWEGPADAVLLEGWLVGCRPLPDSALRSWMEGARLDAARSSWLLRCNQALEAYQALWQTMDAFVMLWPVQWGLPRRWRLQAEARQRRAGGGWLSVTDLDRMIQASLSSLPADLYQRPLLSSACWVIELDGLRRCTWEGSGVAMVERLTQASSA